jgi:hypothetical protein
MNQPRKYFKDKALTSFDAFVRVPETSAKDILKLLALK